MATIVLFGENIRETISNIKLENWKYSWKLWKFFELLDLKISLIRMVYGENSLLKSFCVPIDEKLGNLSCNFKERKIFILIIVTILF